MLEYLLRFIVGGVAVSAFAALGDMLRPKSFAGLFGAAPLFFGGFLDGRVTGVLDRTITFS